MKSPAEWSVYIARCADGSLYTGVAKDVAARLAAHNAGRGAAYTRPRRPLRIVHREDGFTRGQALSREARIKSLARPAKLELVKKAARALAAAAVLLLAAARARAVPAFTPEGAPFFSTASVQSFAPQTAGSLCYPAAASCYPLRMYVIPQSSDTIVASATSPDGFTWTPESLAGELSTTTLPSISASSITAVSVLPRPGGGYEAFYAATSTSAAGDRFAIYTATSTDGLGWGNATLASPPVASAVPIIKLNSGATFVGSPRVVVIPGGNLRMYLIANNDGASDLAARQVFTSLSVDQGVTWSAPAALPSGNAFEVGASQLTDGRVRLYYSQPAVGQSSAALVTSMISADSTGASFGVEAGARISTAAASASLSFPVPVRSSETFRWRLYYDVTNAGVSTGTVFSALTESPAPAAIAPNTMFNTIAAGAITVSGEIFSTPAPTFLLRAGGQPDIIPTGVTRVNDESLTATIDVLGLVPGARDLIVTNADGSATTLPGAFDLTFPPGSVALLDNLISPRSGTSSTKIAIETFAAGQVTAKIFTVDGRHVTTLFDGAQPAGTLSLTWNGGLANGAPAPSGVYILHVTGPETNIRDKIVVIR